jgi:hypothetical protein
VLDLRWQFAKAINHFGGKAFDIALVLHVCKAAIKRQPD